MADHVGWRDIAKAVGKALGWSVSVRSVRRYAEPDWPTPENPRPMPVSKRQGDGVRWLADGDPEFLAWVAWFKADVGQTKPRQKSEPRGDRRRARAA